MRERPIIFSGEMVQAILDSRKTQTRRVVKKTACTCGNPPGSMDCKPKNIGANQWACGSLGYTGDFVRCPYGKPGGRLWVREAFAVMNKDAFDARRSAPFGLRYKSDSETSPNLVFRPSIHMPRWASRITLEITNVRVERLNEISEADAIAEGVKRFEGMYHGGTKQGRYWKAFTELWDKINGKKYSWADNPWVWVIEFETSK